MRPPATFAVDLDLARRLVDDQYAAHDRVGARGGLTHVGYGWDNALVRLGTELVLRLPVRDEAAPLIEKEARWLAEAVAPLAVATSVPVFVGTPTDYYPYPWQVCRWIDGWVVAAVPVAERGALVEPLADALAALHRPAPADAPDNEYRGVPLGPRAEIVAARIERWHGPRDGLRRAWAAAVPAPAWTGPSYWVHGDPHPLNLLVSEDGRRLAGIIDFGDLTYGDPACDLATAWWCFGPEDHARFRARLDATGRYDAHVWTRAAGWAASLASNMEAGCGLLEDVALHTAEQLREP